MATSWINSCSEKKDLRLYLDAVKLELEDNLNMLQKAEEYIDKTLQLSEYLALNESEKHSRDSLKKYKSITQSFYFFVYKTEAFDMLKTSVAMRLLKDKKLLLDIWNGYSRLELYKAEHDDYMRRKINAWEVAISKSKNAASVDISAPNQQRMRSFYMTYGSIGELDECIERVKKRWQNLRRALRIIRYSMCFYF